ncbi:MAG TPA: purine-nucleoside phosphorylase [Gemmatimonadaceae bacterium]|nr:purine-nucleoside phosphorylase [Gemmatimonadaceae bacterium]
MSAAAAAQFLRGRLGGGRPTVALVLGSGLGALVDEIEGAVRVPFAEIPGFPGATVVGHRGAVVAGRLAGRQVVAFAGRFHLYEGHAPATAALPARVAAALGTETLFVSNAAGGIRRTFRAGDLMVIADHINLLWQNPLVGPVAAGEERFPDMSAPYDAALRALAHEAGRAAGVPLVEGVYAALQGPTYETPAEVRMLDRLGADATGMSTVPEVLAARALGMRVVGISCITNMACGITSGALSHDDVLETTRRVAGQFTGVVRELVARL